MPTMRYDQIIRSREGTDRHVQSLEEISVPDIWHTVMLVKDLAEGRTPERQFTKADAEMLLETWSLCHDLLKHIERINQEPGTS
jgi:hypothetical protein